MTRVIYLNGGSRMRKYTATTTGRKSVVKVEIEVNSSDALGWLLRDLDEIDEQQKADKRKADKAAATGDVETPLEQAIARAVQ